MSLFSRLFSFLGKDLAMDLGTANSLLYTQNEGIVLNEPSVVAMDNVTGAVLAVGKEAKEYLGRTPQRITAIRPMKDGVIADFEVTKKMISYFIEKTIKGMRFVKPSIVICVPTGITQVEKRAVIEAAITAGTREVRLVEEPMAAAIGADLPIHEPKGNMVLDIGGGTSEVAVITMSSIAYAESVRVAGDEMNEAVQRFFQDEFKLLIGENTAERVKMRIGTAYPPAQPMTMEVSGRDIVSGTPKSIEVGDAQVRAALNDPVQAIVLAVKKALERTPPELAADIGETGLLLAGGGSLLKGLDRLIAEATNLKVRIDEDPLTTVVRGTGRTLSDRAFFERVYIN
ncbi:MAG: rod shape-determining protein [Desulfovibrionaceae bacterium]|jgi:rod shape-determining protein MreB|nr:rod shape-determining protein [Desulfovibrionaceae bacterium]